MGETWEHGFTSVKLPDKFSQPVQGDVFFYKGETYKAFHVIDECLRYSMAEEILSRERAFLVTSYENVWYKHFGPAAKLYTDGEGGLVSEEAKRMIKRLGTDVVAKAS